jgi:predicted small secreted protein
MKKFTTMFFSVLLCCVLMTSCYTSSHMIGSGAKGGEVIQNRQWFALFGLVPINKVDSKAMAGGATDYTLTTTHSFVDQLIGIFTGFVTIYPITVEVKK